MTKIEVKFFKRAQHEHERKLAAYSLIFRRIWKPVIADQEARFFQRLPLITKPTMKSIMNLDEENHIVGLAMRPVYITAATDAADKLLEKFNVFVKAVSPSRMLNQKLFDYANKYSAAMANHMNKTTIKKIKKVILDGYKEDLTYSQIAKKIKNDVFKDLSQGYRAKLVARTEAHGMVENGSFEAAKASKVVKEKTWSSAADARQTHAEANYQTVLLKDTFIIGGYQMNYPGDMSYGAGLEEIMNCRCSALYSAKIHKDRLTTSKELLARYEAPPIKLPRRGHLMANMNPDEAMHRLVADAKARGIKLEYEESRKMYNSVHAYTSTGSDQGIRIYGSKGLQGLKDAGYAPGEIKRLIREAEYLEKFLKISPKYPEEMIFRGLKLDPEVWSKFAPGQIMDMQGASSFSSEFLVARNKGNVVFGLMKNKAGVSVRHMSGWPAEKEILFSNLAKFRITGIQSTDMGVMVSIVELPMAAPKLKLLAGITRGHLTAKTLMTEQGMSSVQLFIEDSLKDGLPRYSYKEAKAIVDSVSHYTHVDYRMTRLYQTLGPDKFVQHLSTKGFSSAEIKHIKDKVTIIAKNIEEFLKYSPKYPNEIIYRGIRLEPNEIKALLKKGKIIDMRGVSSFTTNQIDAKNYGNVIFNVKNKSGVSVKYLSSIPSENEIIMANNMKFRILDIKKALDGNTYVALEEIGIKTPIFTKPVMPVWKPVMTPAEADLWAKGSTYANDTFYHGTSSMNAAQIKTKGFKVAKLGTNTNNGGMFGPGNYVTQSKNYASKYGDLSAGGKGELLRVKINLNNVLTDENIIYQIGMDSDRIATAGYTLKDLSLSEAKKKASLFMRDSLNLINEKEWIQIKALLAKEKYGVESIRTFMFKKNGYDGVFHKAYGEFVVFDDKSLVVVKQELFKAPIIKPTGEQIRASVEAYQDGAFQSINGYLRGEKISAGLTNRVQLDIINLDAAMSASKEMSYLYRGDGAAISSNLFEKIPGIFPTKISAEQALFGRIEGKTYAQYLNSKLKGKIFKDLAFTSTSLDSKLVMDNFVNGSTELTKYGATGVVEIIAPKGTSMLDVEKFSLMGAGEREVLLPRGTAFRIDMVDIRPYQSATSTAVRFYIRYVVSVIKVAKGVL